MSRQEAFRLAMLFGFMACWVGAGQELSARPAWNSSLFIAQAGQAQDDEFRLDDSTKDTDSKKGDEGDQAGESAGDEKQTGDSLSFWGIIKAGGPTELVIILLSIVGVGLSIEHFVTLREKKLLTPGLADNIGELIEQGHIEKAKKFCNADKSLMGMILREGLRRIDVGEEAVKEAISEAGARGVADLENKISYLNFIGTTEPLLGLLGTVTGMIVCFNTIAFSEGLGKPGLLALGVSQALITTASGLIVSIPIMSVFFYFKGKVRKVMLRAEEQSLSVIYAVGRLHAKMATGAVATTTPAAKQPEAPTAS